MDSKQGTSQKIAVLGGRSELNPNARMGNKKKKKKNLDTDLTEKNKFSQVGTLKVMLKTL